MLTIKLVCFAAKEAILACPGEIIELIYVKFQDPGTLMAGKKQ